jgi:hypothetical protein
MKGDLGASGFHFKTGINVDHRQFLHVKVPLVPELRVAHFVR